MTREEFWYGNPRLAVSYREAHELRNEMRNQEMWMQGLYNYRAFSSVIETLAYGFSGGKGSKPSKYPESPFPISEREQQAQIEKNKKRTMAWVEQGQH